MPLTKLNSASVIERLPVGSVIQTKQSVQNLFLDLVCSGSNLTDITGLSVSITPTSTSSQILITYSINVGYYHNFNGIGFVLCKGSTAITNAVGNASGRGNRQPVTTSGAGVNGYHMSAETFAFLDSPATTSATTYSLKIRDGNGDGGKAYLNGSLEDGAADLANRPRGSSTITVQEIKG
jgi:hypothetical protein